MSKINWSEQQKKAINTKYISNGDSCNILVGAAAGSGKTAVLVERVIKKLVPLNIKDAIDADKLLIVTFTNSAAREMSERINKALANELDMAIKSGDTERKKLIKRQMLLLLGSDITTIDAFCLKLIRSNFNLLDLDPSFSIADDAQAKILSEEAETEVFDELYSSGDEDFIKLLSLYATNRTDDGLSKIVLWVYKFISSIPYPFDWLSGKVSELSMPNGIKNTKWFLYAMENVKKNIDLALFYTEKALFAMLGKNPTEDVLLENPPIDDTPAFKEWKNAYKAFYYDFIFFSQLKDADFDTSLSLISEFSFNTLTFPKTKNPENVSYFKDLRNNVKNIHKKIKEFICLDTKEIERIYKEHLYPTADAILKLTQKYHARFIEKKLSKNLLEFFDIEQLCLKLLSEHPEIRNEMRDKYHEIMMDEYQDTSSLQEEIFSLISDGKNLFMVGDMKQSIYRFRNSDPTIFKSKNDLYQVTEDAENRKILLSENFRSRHEVLESINDVFETIMSEAAGELTYDDDQRLYTGNKDYKNVNQNYKSECCIIEGINEDSFCSAEDDEDEDELTKQEAEARFIASEINRLKAEHFLVKDGDTYREIENRDIVILMSSYKSSADSFIAELNSAGIDCFVETNNYFDRSEIRLMIALLKVINNPYSDIPLIGIMRSPIFSFTDDELVIIRKCTSGKFFTAVKNLAKKYQQEELSDNEEIAVAKKAESFLADLNRWRDYAHFMSSDKLVWTLYEETDFYAFCGAMYDGEEAQANLRLLFERAKDYENNGFQGLFNFIKYIERIKNRDESIQSAKLIGEGHNVVRIMTIHKSKGLEFPVVFVAGGSNKLKRSVDDSRLILHKDYGICMDYINFEESYTYSPPSKAIFKEIQNAEQTAEDIRKLYVAFTRAKEKLYFVGYVSGKVDKAGLSVLQKRMKIWKSHDVGGTLAFAPSEVLSSVNFADWVCPVALFSDNWLFRAVKINSIQKNADTSKTDSKKSCTPTIDISHILDFEYPYSDIASLPTKLSVSELKANSNTQIKPIPSFLSGVQTGGTSYGTCIHKILESFVPKANMKKSDVEACIDELAKQGKIEKQDVPKVNPQKILDFYSSDLGKRIMASSAVYREVPFEVEIEADKLYCDIKNAKGETILLQGVIDCYFEEEDGIVLVDYKTDVYEDVSEIHEKYDTQLSLYAYALQKITKKPIKNKFFYLFFDNNVV